MISKNINVLRRKQGLTQEKLAQKMNVSRQAITKWENGESLPDIENVRILAEIFDVSIDALVGGATRPDRRELEKQMNRLIIYLTGIGGVIFLMTLIDSLFNFEERHMIGFMALPILVIVGIWIKSYVIRKRLAKEGDILELQNRVSRTMTDFLGRPLPIGRTKEARLKRIRYASLDALIFASTFMMIDLITYHSIDIMYMLQRWLINFSFFFIFVIFFK